MQKDALPVARRFNLALRTDETHFFAASRAMVPRLLMRYLKPLMGCRANARRVRCATRRPSAVAVESSGNDRPESMRVCASEFEARARPPLSLTRRSRVSCLSHDAHQDGSTEFQVNSSNRFSASAEAAHPSTGRTQPGPREARFPFHTAEWLFVLSTRPAVGLPRPKFISSLMRARRPFVGVAPDLRGT